MYVSGSSHVGHRLHWDTEEMTTAGNAQLQGVRHPLYSSVLYLQAPADSNSGATVVVDHRIGSRDSCCQGWGVMPRANRLLTFEGGMLHGVLPRWSGESDGAGHRVTLMAGWWLEAIAAPAEGVLRPGERESFCTCMRC